jgi:hypothetical protein
VARGAARLQIGHQLDVPLAAEGIQLQDVLAAQRTAPGADPGMARELEGVLGVELKHVDLVLAQLVDEVLKRRHGGHLAPRDVEQEAPGTQAGPIADGQRRNMVTVQAHQLA